MAVQIERGVGDFVEAIQDNALALICPLAGGTYLYTYESMSWHVCRATHRQVPLINIMEGMNAGIEISREAKYLNPEQKTGCEEFVDGLEYSANVGTISRDHRKVLRPEPTCIAQCAPNVNVLTCREIFDLAEARTTIQVANILPQPFLH